MKITMFVMWLLSAVVLAEYSSADVYIAPNGAAVFPYDSWATAATGVVQGVQALQRGAIAWVTNGTYTVSQSVMLTNSTTLKSVNGAAVTIIDAAGSCRPVYLSNGSTVDGVTLSNGRTNEGGGVYIRESGTIKNCAIERCRADNSGGGVYMYYGGRMTDCVVTNNTVEGPDSLTASEFLYGGGIHFNYGGRAEHCTFANNSVTSSNRTGGETFYSYGGGAHCQGGGTLYNCRFYNNIAYAKNVANGGAVKLHEGGVMINCLVYDNVAVGRGSTYASAAGGGVMCDLGGVVQNCTISENSVVADDDAEGGGIYFFRGGLCRNTIAYNNSGASGNNWMTNEPGQTIDFCCSLPLMPGDGNISDAPLFFNRLGRNFHLTALSPCKDTGSSTNAPAIDLDGISRPLDAGYDMGAYEYVNPVAGLVANIAASDGAVVGNVALTWAPATDASSYAVFRNTNDQLYAATLLQTGVASTNCTDTNVVGATVYYYWVKAVNGPFSSYDTGYAIPVAGLVSNIVASDGEYVRRVALTWAPATDATSYVVFRNTNDQLYAANELQSGITTTNCTDTNVVGATVYYYWVKAVNGDFSGYDTGYAKRVGIPLFLLLNE